MKCLLFILGIVVVLILLLFFGKFLYKYFITKRIMDKDGMINPNYKPDSKNTPIDDTEEKSE